MSPRFVVVGTDTGVGKTIFAAALVGAMDAFYWKPVQAGLDGETDSQTVARLSGVAAAQILPEAWRLQTAASPHIAARREGVAIDPAALNPPACPGPLVIETAGGVMAPLTVETPTIDVLARWRSPTILVARTSLGTVNHSLLTIEALRRRNIPICGVAFVGDAEPEAQISVLNLGAVPLLGRLPHIAPLSRETLRRAFAAAFSLNDFL